MDFGNHLQTLDSKKKHSKNECFFVKYYFRGKIFALKLAFIIWSKLLSGHQDFFNVNSVLVRLTIVTFVAVVLACTVRTLPLLV